MKSILSKPSGSPPHRVRADKPGGPVTVVSGPPAPSFAPAQPTLIVKRGAISKIARKPRLKRVPIAFPARIIGGLLVVPKVLDEIEFNRRVVIVKAANVLLDHGISQKKAAAALGVAPSQLSVWRQRYAVDGKEALRPAPWGAGRKAATGRTRRHTAFLELQTARR